jgi:hypothetical protein
MKSNLIANYIGYLRKGKLRMKDAKYTTIVSNPYEMLLATIGKYNGESIMANREVYCQYYDDKQEFCISRNPHINAGNVMYGKNVYHPEYKWFNFTDHIMAVNFFDNDMPSRLQGEDTDSDSNLVLPHPILVEKAKYCEEHFPTPINQAQGVSKLRKYNMSEIQKLDSLLSNNYIGKIINLSQIINSYMNDAILRKESFELIDTLYQASSRLSSLSQIEIDKSKKVFDNVNMSKELTKIRQLPCLRYVDGFDKRMTSVRKMVVPEFFSMISDCDEYRIYEKFGTPLDILQDVLVFKGGKRLYGDKHKNFGELLITSKELTGLYQTRHIDLVFNIVDKCGKKINVLRLSSCELNDKAKKTVEKKVKREAIDRLKNLSINEVTVLNILKQCFGVQENRFSKYSMLTLNLLFVAKKVEVLKCFRDKNSDFDEVLVKMKSQCDFDLFGNKYQKILKSELISL